jgi:hypothetical protein
MSLLRHPAPAAKFVGLANPIGYTAQMLHVGGPRQSATRRHPPTPSRTWLPRVGSDVTCVGGRAMDELLRHELGRTRPGPLLPPHPRMRPCVRRRRPLRCPPTQRQLLNPTHPEPRPDPERHLATSPRPPRPPAPPAEAAPHAGCSPTRPASRPQQSSPIRPSSTEQRRIAYPRGAQKTASRVNAVSG